MNKRRLANIILVVVLASIVVVVGIVIAAQVSDSFTDTTKIAESYQLNVDTTAGQVKLAAWNCGDTFTDPRDGTTYTTVQIGSQCWMAENLNYGTQINGANNQTNNGTVEKYCYNDTASNCDTYGGLYQWDEAMDYSSSCNGTGSSQPACTTPVQGICPPGWHIPSHYEWTALEQAVCSSTTCATDFPYDTSTTGWRGTNEGTSLKQNGSSGFEALLPGQRTPSGSFSGFGSYGVFWSSLESGSSAWFRQLSSGSSAFRRGLASKLEGFSVRCVKDWPLNSKF